MSEPSTDAAAWRTRVRAIVLHPRLPAALVVGPPDGPALPEFELPGKLWAGKPQRFVQAVRDLLGLEVALLREAEQRADEDGSVLHTTLVFAVRDSGAPIPANARWLGVDGAAGLVDLAAVLGEVADGGVPAGRPPWRDRAWLDTAESWIAGSLAALGRPVCGPVEQFRMAELSCVLRAPTGRGDAYFKATVRSPLFVDEGRVMAALSDLFPEHVPAPLAIDSRRGWMLLPDLGPEIGWQAPIELHTDVLRAFATLQIRSVGFVDRLLAAGCFDRRPPWLARQATEWPATVDLSEWLSGEEVAALTAVAADLAGYCTRLNELPVPCAIGHGDMHLGNVARSDDGYAFFDWSDACVMHPFLDMITVFNDDDAATREGMRDAYLAEWASFAPRAQLLEAWRLAEPLAALNQAISYVSLASHLEPGADRDGLRAETGTWLRKLLDWRH